MTQGHFHRSGTPGYRTYAYFQRMGLIPEAPEEVEEDESVESGEGLQGVYIISVAARILEMHPQTLRKYERFGFISPFRTVGVRRLYSEEDIARLRLIKHLVGDLGLNLAGVQLVLDLFNELLNARAQTEKLEGAELKAYLTKALDTLFTLLYTGQSTGSDD